MYYRSGGFAIVLSAVGLVVGTIVLVARRRLGDLLLFYLLFLSVPAYMKFIAWPVENANSRVWLALPVAMLLPAWVMSGAYLVQCAMDNSEPTLREQIRRVMKRLSRNLETRSGGLGVVIFIIASVAWVESVQLGSRLSAMDMLFVLGGWALSAYFLLRERDF